MQLFYTPDIEGNKYVLDEQESKHCIRVLRMQKGTLLHLTNGKGTLFEASISDANPKACQLEITKIIENFEGRNYSIHMALAPTKNIERFEWFLEKATEMGVDEITPLLCEHSERKQINTDRLERIIISALKQSIKAYKPKLNPIVSFDDFVSSGFTTPGYIAHCQNSPKKSLKSMYSAGTNSILLIGPEGDFSTQEIEQAEKKGFLSVSLGQSRLRTETAGVLACHTIHLANTI